MLKLNQAADTIIEVLLAIAVLSLVLSGAYAISNRSFTDISMAQEHSQALQIAQEQAERLKQLADGGGADGFGGNIFTGGATFCVGLSAGSPKIQVSCSTGSPITFSSLITRSAVAGSARSKNFYIKVTWPGIHGGTDDVTLNYRLDS